MRTARVAMLVLSCCVVGLCSEKQAGPGKETHNPYAGNHDATQAGRKLYLRHCATCHGNDANGSRKSPGLRGANVKNATDTKLFEILSNGIQYKGMPEWSSLPEQQRWQIITYLRSLQ